MKTEVICRKFAFLCTFRVVYLRSNKQNILKEKITFPNEKPSALVMACLTLALSLLLTLAIAQDTKVISVGRIKTKDDISTSRGAVMVTEVSQYSQTFSGNLLETITNQTQPWNRKQKVLMTKNCIDGSHEFFFRQTTSTNNIP